jgi:ribulose-phosphate 3-epimerase
VRRLKGLLAATGSSAQIEIDGGVDPSTINDVVSAGATILVAGNAIFASGDAEAATRALRAAANAPPPPGIRA